jgi:hypothetical protein
MQAVLTHLRFEASVVSALFFCCRGLESNGTELVGVDVARDELVDAVVSSRGGLLLSTLTRPVIAIARKCRGLSAHWGLRRVIVIT